MGIGVASGIQAAGMGMSAMGAYNQAMTQKATLGYESAVASNNAQIANYQAQTEQAIGAQQENAQQQKTANMMGAQRATMAANGIDLGQGSASDILTSTQFMGERDALTIRDNTARQAWAYNMNAQNYRGEAATDRAMGSAISPGVGAAASLLTGAASLSSNWKRYGDATNGVGLSLATSMGGK